MMNVAGTGNVNFSSGTVNLNTSFNSAFGMPVNVSGAMVNFNGPATVDILNVASGTMAGSGGMAANS